MDQKWGTFQNNVCGDSERHDGIGIEKAEQFVDLG
jgi:hypothetical protein